MKKIIIAIATLFLSTSLFAQADIKSNEVTWFGVDFSKAKMVGEAGFTDPAKIQSYYFNEWNNLIITESEKYNIGKYFKKTKVNRNLDISKKRNANVLVADLVTNNSHSISTAEAEAVAKAYAKSGDGLGLVFVVENFDKTTESASIYVVFFDMKTGKALSSKKVSGKPGGFGVRNYWLGAILDVMKRY